LRIGKAGARADLYIDQTRSCVDETTRAKGDDRSTGVAEGIDGTGEQDVVGKQFNPAIIARDPGVDKDGAARLQAQIAAIARGIIDQNCRVDGDVVVRLKRDAGSARKDRGKRAGADRHIPARIVTEAEARQPDRAGGVEEIDRPGIADPIFGTVVSGRAHHQPAAIERQRTAEKVGNACGTEVDIGRAVIPAADARGERGVAAKARAGHSEEIGRAYPRLLVARAAIARRADRQGFAAQRHRRSEKIATVQRRHPIGPGIVHTQRACERRRRKGGVGKGEQMHRACAGPATQRAIIAGRADGKPQPVKRERRAKAVRAVQYRQVKVAASRIAAADGSRERRSEQGRIGEGDEVDRTAIGDRIASTVVTRRPDDQPGIQKRDRAAEPVVGIEADPQIVAAGIANTDLAQQAAAVEVGVDKGEKIHGAGIGNAARCARIARRAHGEPGPIERNCAAKGRPRRQLAHRDILAAAIAASHDALQNGCRKIGIGKGEKIDRARVGNVDARAIIARCADRQAVAVERYRRAEIVVEFKARDRRAEAACIAGADGTDQPHAAEIEIGKGEQIDRARIIDIARIAEAVVRWRADHEPAAVERHRRSEEIELVQLDVKIEIGAEIGKSLAQDFGNRAAAKTAVGKAQQIDRTRTDGAGGGAGEPRRANGQSIAIERNRMAEKASVPHAEWRQRRVDIPRPIIAGADDAALDSAGKGEIGKSEQIDRARADQAVAVAVIAKRTDHQTRAIERHRRAEPVEIVERDIQIVATGIEAEPDNGLQSAALEQRIGKGEQIDRPGLALERGGIACGVVAIGPDRQSVAIERNRCAEAVIGLDIGQADVLAAPIVQADNGFERSTGKLGVGEAEQIDGAGKTGRVPGARIIGCADSQTVAVERNRGSETVSPLDLRDEQVLAADIAMADHRLQGRAPEQEIGEGEQIDRARIDQAVDRTVIAPGPDREADSIERNRIAETVACTELRKRWRGRSRQVQPHRSAIVGADRAGQAAAAERGIAELEELHRAAVRLAVGGAVIPWRADG